MSPAVLLLRPLREGHEMRFLTTMPEACRGYWHSKQLFRPVSQEERSSIQK
jgi:hypothetical protein